MATVALSSALARTDPAAVIVNVAAARVRATAVASKDISRAREHKNRCIYLTIPQ